MNKKEDIIKAALHLLVKKGIHATPMSLIAKHAGTGMGTIYNYFENKEILLNRIYISIKNEEKEVLESVFSNEMPVKIQFESYYKAVISYFKTNREGFRFLQQLNASPIITKETKEVGYESIDHVIKLLEKGKQENIIKNISTTEILQFIGGCITSYINWVLENDELDKEEKTVKNHIRLVWDGIKE